MLPIMSRAVSIREYRIHLSVKLTKLLPMTIVVINKFLYPPPYSYALLHPDDQHTQRLGA